MIEAKQQYKIITLNDNGSHNPIKGDEALAKMKREKQDNFLARNISFYY